MKSFERILELSKTTSQSPERLKLLNQRDGNNKTPLVHAVENGSAAIASALLREGASPLFHELYNAQMAVPLLLRAEVVQAFRNANTAYKPSRQQRGGRLAGKEGRCSAKLQAAVVRAAWCSASVLQRPKRYGSKRYRSFARTFFLLIRFIQV